MSEIGESIDRLVAELESLRTISRRLERVEFERSRLQQALGLLSRYVKQAMEGMVLLDTQGRVLLANEAYATAHDYQAEDLIGKHQSVFHTPDQIDRLDDVVRQVSAEGEFKGEVWHARKDGSVFPAFIHRRSVEDDDGNPVGYIESMRDVTELKNAEEAARESEERFKTQFRGIPIPVYIWRKVGDDFVLADFNRAAEVTTEGKIEQLKGIKARELYREDPEIREQMWECYKSQQAFDREMLYQLRTTGEEKHLVVSYGYVPPDTVLVHTQNITERVRAEEALKESEEKYRDLVENINDVICTCDLSGTVTYVNPAVKSLLGYAPSEVLGHLFAEFLPDEEVPRVAKRFQVVLNGESAAGEYRLRAKSGEDRWIRTSSRPILEDGRVVGLHSVLGDISESKRAEEAIRESEQKFRMLAEQSPNIIFISKMGRIAYVNPRAEEIMGYSKSEFYRDDFDYNELVAPEFHEQTRLDLARHQRGEEVEPVEYAIITKSGQRLDALITTKLIDYEGERSILGIVTDITDRKVAERAMRDSEMRHRAISELCSDSAYEVRIDGDGGFVLEWASEEDNRFSAFPIHRIVRAADWQAMIHHEDLAIVKAHFEKLLSGQRDSAEFRVKTKTGETRSVRNSAQPVWDENRSRVTRVHGVVQDVGAEAALAATLRESERWYRRLVEQSSHALITEQNGRIVFANDACAALLGAERPETLIGQEIFRFIRAERLAYAEGSVTSSEKGTGSLPEIRGECVRVDGTRISTELAAGRISFQGAPARQFSIRLTDESD